MFFSFDKVSSSTRDSIHVWLPDPNVEYLTGVHIVLFVIAFLFLLFFILPFVICFIFPRLVLRSKRLSYFFPMLDFFLAPYKHKYRFWFGLHALVLLYLSAMEAVIFSSREALLLSSRGVAKAGTGRAQAQPISFSPLPTQFAETIQARSKYPNIAVTLIQESSIISMIIN